MSLDGAIYADHFFLKLSRKSATIPFCQMRHLYASLAAEQSLLQTCTKTNTPLDKHFRIAINRQSLHSPDHFQRFYASVCNKKGTCLTRSTLAKHILPRPHLNLAMAIRQCRIPVTGKQSRVQSR
ncbi:hypothetical protein FPOAC1_001295 [Fusarium poae]|uniref:hypothetical protein n=1 Tax=Fusarium poae TaxID=36050 RepID=UPI001CE9CFB7|nr:hypothetical protein FPOAC1_001295 [Fusarium poae]KAG8675317.1 hypothetical protein FPOAC1_001295 [Fusarium poae]